MTSEPLVPISLDGYVAFLVMLALIMAVMFWLMARHQKNKRKQFFAKFDASDLRMSAHQIGLVYRVTGLNDDMVSVVPIWRGRSPILNGQATSVSAAQLIPFDESRFF